MPKLTARDLKQRARSAGIDLPEDEVEPTLQMLNNALEPIRAFDTTADRTREPSPIFRA